MKQIKTLNKQRRFYKKLFRFKEKSERSNRKKILAISNTDFSNCDICDLVLPKSQLVFSNCYFTDMIFHDSLLNYIVFKDCIFRRCIFRGCYMNHSSFIGNTYLYNTIFEKCNIKRSVMSYIDLKLCRFIECDLSRSLFNYSTITQSSLKDSVLEYTQFFGTSFIGDINTSGSVINDCTTGLAPLYDPSIEKGKEGSFYYSYMVYYDEKKADIIVIHGIATNVITTTRNFMKSGQFYIDSIRSVKTKEEFSEYKIENTGFCGNNITLVMGSNVIEEFSEAEIGPGFKIYNNEEIAILSIPYYLRKMVLHEENNQDQSEPEPTMDNKSEIEVLSVDDIETPDDLDLDKVLEEDNN